jgi:nitrous oxidase accessory protein NosD
MNKEYGFKTGMPFMIETQMGCKRVIQVIGDKLVMKRKNGYKDQRFIFNDDHRSIESFEFTDQSVGIHATGKNRAVEMQATKGNAKWF